MIHHARIVFIQEGTPTAEIASYQRNFCFKKFLKKFHGLCSLVLVETDQMFDNNDDQRNEATKALGFLVADVFNLESFSKSRIVNLVQLYTRVYRLLWFNVLDTEGCHKQEQDGYRVTQVLLC